MVGKLRREAAADGDVKYPSARKCAYGHQTFRYTSNGMCVDCVMERQTQYREYMKSLSKKKA